jgi:uncharacterized lipoprotein YddW (UPF0748 family)
MSAPAFCGTCGSFSVEGGGRHGDRHGDRHGGTALRAVLLRSLAMRTRPLLSTIALATLAACAGPIDVPDAREDGAALDDATRDAFAPREDGGALDAAATDAQNTEDASVLADATDTDGRTDARADASADAAQDAGAEPALVAVSHEREFRAMWVASVYNLTYPSSASLNAAQLRAELQTIVDTAAATGLNAIVFQIRPESDALYRSTIEPWSRFLTGTQGRDPGIDPLDVLVTLAHQRAIEVHAWMNPYRGAADTRFTTASNSVTRTLSQHAVRYNNAIVMNPGADAVRAHIVRVVRDVATRYAVDGVHFDDYFYPYPDAMSTPFADDDLFNAYRAAGGTITNKNEWRRDNVNRMIAESSAAARAARPTVRFGVSPFGIYRPGMPAGINGLDAYNVIACDPLAWVRAGSVDYIAPQLYWPTTQTAQSYNTLLPWWAEQTRGRAYVFAGNDITKIGTTAAWTIDEIRAQIRTSRANRDRGSLGNVFFQGRQILRDTMGVAAMLRRDFYGAPALPPPLITARGTVDPPSASPVGNAIAVAHAAPATVRAWALYRFDAARSSWVIDRVSSASSAMIATVSPGRWAVSAVALDDRESLGRVVEVR